MNSIEAVAALDDRVRRGLYEFVRRAHRAVTRQEAAHSQRVSVKLAAFHLDKLVAVGLLRAHSEPPEGSVRGVGRSPKRYEPSDAEVSLTLPPRRYELLGEVLLETLAELQSASSRKSPTSQALRISRRHGQEYASRSRVALGRPGTERTLATCSDLLEGLGFDPVDDDAGGLVLLNCPFRGLVQRAPQLVCAINAAFVDGLLVGLGSGTMRALLNPGPGRCCVCIQA